MRRINRKAAFKEFARWMQNKCLLEESTAKRYAQIVSKMYNSQKLAPSDNAMKPSAIKYWNEFIASLDDSAICQEDVYCPVCGKELEVTSEDVKWRESLKKVICFCPEDKFVEVYYFRAQR